MSHQPPPRATIVGGGPAGLMAAQILAEGGCAVTIYELHRSLGRKFLLAGRSGLNLTYDPESKHAQTVVAAFAPPIRDAIAGFGPDAVRGWAEDLDQSTFVGSTGRVFPEAMRAAPLLRSWLRRLNDLGVVSKPQHRWLGFGDDDFTHRFRDRDGVVITAASDITFLAMGGASWPRVSSPGGWVGTLTDAGVAIEPLQASNCGVRVAWSSMFLERFEGQPLKNVRVVIEHGTDRTEARGDLVVTSAGLEGGPIYAVGPALRSGLAAGDHTILLDLMPDLDTTAICDRLARSRAKDSRSTQLRKAGCTPIQIALVREATGNLLPDDHEALAQLLVATPIEVQGLMPIDRAISTAGGVRLDALDDSFMMRDRPGTYVVGEMLDGDAPTGGYLLQTCFATAHRAATAAIAEITLSTNG